MPVSKGMQALTCSLKRPDKIANEQNNQKSDLNSYEAKSLTYIAAAVVVVVVFNDESNFCLEKGFDHAWKEVRGTGFFQTLSYRIYPF